MNLILVPEGRLESPPVHRTDLDAYQYWERQYTDAIINSPIQISQAVDKTHCASQGHGRLTKHYNESHWEPGEAFGSIDSQVIQSPHAESYSGLARPAVNLGTAVGAATMAEYEHAHIAKSGI